MKTPKFIATLALLVSTTSTFAHEGHGLSGSHWHPTDVWGFVAVAAALALAVWLSRNGK